MSRVLINHFNFLISVELPNHLLNEWEPQFTELRISKTLLSQALSLKPENAPIEPLYNLCKKIRTSYPTYEFETSWELCLLSQDLGWVKNQLPLISDTTITSIYLMPLHYVAESGALECFKEVLKAFPKWKTAKPWRDMTVAHSAAIFSQPQFALEVLKIIPELSSEKDSVFRFAIQKKTMSVSWGSLKLMTF